MSRTAKHVKVVCATVVTAFAVTGSIAGVARAGQPHDNRTTQTCERVVTSVSLESGTHDIVGELCWRGQAGGKTLQVLTSGYTYDHTYWDYPHQPETYSYVEAATAAGYATYNYDRLGVGRSDLPGDLPESLSVVNQAEVLHQLVDAARSGQITRTRFRDVVSVGHSLGSSIAIYEAGVHGDVDAVMLTGNMRNTQPDFVGVPVHPAVDDPKFADSGLSEQVLASVPGGRDHFFYAPNVDSAILHVDEGLKQTGVLTEVLTIPTAYGPGVAGNITVPVLFVVGQHDFLYCDTAAGFPCDTTRDILDRQVPMLPNAPCVDAVVIEDAGHALNLHLNAPDVFAAVNTWGARPRDCRATG